MTAEAEPMTNRAGGRDEAPDMFLFWGCFVALIATAFAFILRSLIIPEWGDEFGLTNTQQGELAGAGLWPFAITIVLFSLVLDRFGSRNSMIFAFVCHIAAVVLTVTANGYAMLYVATVVAALGNGTVEAVINPVVATMFSRDKTKWLNILHAGWPGGLVVGGLIALLLGTEVGWRTKMLLLILPTVAYGVMLFRRKFPITERVQAGVSYRDMLRELGAGGAFIIVSLMVFQVGQVAGWPTAASWVITAAVVIGYWFYVRSIGRPLLLVLLLIMIPLATTELGTDSWITDLMTPEMAELGLQAGWVLVYTSMIMLVLRFFAGPIVHKASPLGLLALSSAIAIVGLYWLSASAGFTILLAATLYGLGKTFFWPTMLGVVAEQSPRGGALTLNVIAGVGMIGSGVLGTAYLGLLQDRQIESDLLAYDRANQSALHETYVTLEKESLFGTYTALDVDKVSAGPDAAQEAVKAVEGEAKKGALRMVVWFPTIMLVSYLVLILWFRSRGGYRVVDIGEASSG